MPKGNNPSTGEEGNQPAMGAAGRALRELSDNLTEAKARLEAAGVSRDIIAMLEWAGKVKLLESQVVKAEKVVKDAEFERTAEERMTASLQLKDAVTAFAGTIDLGAIYPIGLRGFSVTFNDDGSTNVNVQAANPPSKVGAVRKVGVTKPGGTPNPRSTWIADFQGGRGYTTREMLETFGGEDGMIAIRKTIADDPEYGYAGKLTASGKPVTNPGFNVEAEKLARTMGWDGDRENRRLLHEPVA